MRHAAFTVSRATQYSTGMPRHVSFRISTRAATIEYRYVEAGFSCDQCQTFCRPSAVGVTLTSRPFESTLIALSAVTRISHVVLSLGALYVGTHDGFSIASPWVHMVGRRGTKYMPRSGRPW